MIREVWKQKKGSFLIKKLYMLVPLLCDTLIQI